MSSMTYKGYAARIEFDAEDEIFFGRVVGIEDGINFHGDTVDNLRKAFHEAVDDYLALCAETGRQPQKAYSGKLMLRVSADVHAAAARAAELSGKSLNAWSEEVLRRGAETSTRRPRTS